MNEESQVRGCYNFLFAHQPGNSVGSPLNQMHRQQLGTITNSRPATGGTLGERGRGGPSAQVLTL